MEYRGRIVIRRDREVMQKEVRLKISIIQNATDGQKIKTQR